MKRILLAAAPALAAVVGASTAPAETTGRYGG
jgi:hypothetical protein